MSANPATLLYIVQAASRRVLASTPTVAASNADPKVQQLVECVNEDGQELSARHTWQALRNEAKFSTVSVAGGITAFGTLIGGAGYALGFSNTYIFVPLTGGSGTGALATIAVTSGVVTSVTISTDNPGMGYQVGDVLSADPSTLGGQIASGAVYITTESGTVITTEDGTPLITEGSGGGGSPFSIVVAQVGIVGQEDQGSIFTLAGPDFAFMVNETMWNRTQRRPVFGPKSPAEWQQLKAQFMQGPWIQYILRGNELLMLPAPSPGFAIYFEWISRYWAQSSAAQGQEIMVQDTDTTLLSWRLHVLGAIWRFKQKNKLDYTEDFDTYEKAVQDAIGRDGSKGRLNLAGAQSDIYPGVVVPAGSWPISGSPGGP